MKVDKSLLLSLSLMVGCGEASPLGQRTQQIIGGTADSGDPAVVLLYIQNLDTGSSALCTGEVISPHVVLTAAHCVDPDQVGAFAQVSLFTGAELSKVGPSAFFPVRETHFHPNYTPGAGSNDDIAVVITNASLSIPPLPLNRKALTSDWVGKPVRLVGYGITDGSDQKSASSGVRRTTSTVLGEFDDFVVHVGGPGHLNCNGDSGGPALVEVDGVEAIVGVTSYGDSGCQAVSVDTRVDVFADSFIQPYIDQFDPSLGASADSGGSMNGGAPMDGGAPIGADCRSSDECADYLCATHKSGAGYCTASCSASAAVCVNGTECGAIDGQPYCVRKLQGSGCSAAPGELHTTIGASSIVFLFTIYFICCSTKPILRRTRGVVGLVVFLALLGCENTGAGGRDGAGMSVDGGGGDAQDASTIGNLDGCVTSVMFQNDIASGIFATSCNGEACHVRSSAGELSLVVGAAYEDLVGAPAANLGAAARNKLRVVAGDPDHSFLWQKLNNLLESDEGSPMPYRVPWTPLAADQLNAIRCWIAAGAPNN